MRFEQSSDQCDELEKSMKCSEETGRGHIMERLISHSKHLDLFPVNQITSHYDKCLKGTVNKCMVEQTMPQILAWRICRVPRRNI